MCDHSASGPEPPQQGPAQPIARTVQEPEGMWAPEESGHEMIQRDLPEPEIELKVNAPGFDIPESMLFGHRTRMLDSWTPEVERIVKPAMKIDPGEIVIRVTRGNTGDFAVQPRTRNPARMLRRRRTLSMPDKYIFDSRYDTDGNIAHQVHHLANLVLLAKRELKAALGGDVEIHFILRSNPARFTLELHRLLGIPVITTDARVEGKVVHFSLSQVATHVDGGVMGGAKATDSLLPEIFDGYQHLMGDRGTPEKIFVTRRGTRSLINEAEIAQLLESRGFEKVYFEGIPVAEQLRLMGNAREIVAIHGAALAFLVFNRNGLARPQGELGGLRLIQLFPAGYNISLFRRHAAVMNAHWCAVRGQVTSDVIRDLDERNLPRSHEKSPFRVDPMSLNMALDYSASASVSKVGSLASSRIEV
jgi:Glycosyltransferase 61